MKPKIFVIGSINMDLVIRTQIFPKEGETLSGCRFKMLPGGKGANQALAIVRLGGQSAILGRVGKDFFGEDSVRNLAKQGVDISCIIYDENLPTGIATIMVDDQGENTILVAPGANTKCSRNDINLVKEKLSDYELLLLQLEIPIETVDYAIDIAKDMGIKIILDAGPAKKCPKELLRKVDILSPNESEVEALIGKRVIDVDSAEEAANRFLEMGVRSIVLKLGKNGALVANNKGITHLPGIKVDPVDTTGAGDTFSAALAVGYASGQDLIKAASYANYAAALSVTKIGAQSSIPTKEEVSQFIEKCK